MRAKDYFLPLGRVTVTQHVRKKKNGASVIKRHLRDKWPHPKGVTSLNKALSYRLRILKEIENAGNYSYGHLQTMHRRLKQVNKKVEKLWKEKGNQ